MKNKIMKFWGFPKSGIKFLEIYFLEKKKKFEVKYILRISSPDFGKPQKLHDFVLSSPEF